MTEADYRAEFWSPASEEFGPMPDGAVVDRLRRLVGASAWFDPKRGMWVFPRFPLFVESATPVSLTMAFTAPMVGGPVSLEALARGSGFPQPDVAPTYVIGNGPGKAIIYSPGPEPFTELWYQTWTIESTWVLMIGIDYPPAATTWEDKARALTQENPNGGTTFFKDLDQFKTRRGVRYPPNDSRAMNGIEDGSDVRRLALQTPTRTSCLV